MLAFNILLVRPLPTDPSFVHRQCFLEVADVLRYGIEDLGHRVVVNDSLQKDCVNLILGYHLLRGKRLPDGYRCVIYQLEQLSESRHPLFLETLRSPCIIWDFSEQNIAFLAQKGIQAIYKPIGFHPRMERIARKTPPDVDVLFYGSVNERRRNILTKLQRQFAVQTLFGVYGWERDAWIGRAKVVLAVHFYENRLFDEVRLSYLLNNRICTIVENTPHRKYEDFIVYADYDHLVDTCGFYLANDQLRVNAAEKAFRSFSEYPEREFLRAALAADVYNS